MKLLWTACLVMWIAYAGQLVTLLALDNRGLWAALLIIWLCAFGVWCRAAFTEWRKLT
jgi:hypothetical protein